MLRSLLVSSIVTAARIVLPPTIHTHRKQVQAELSDCYLRITPLVAGEVDEGGLDEGEIVGFLHKVFARLRFGAVVPMALGLVVVYAGVDLVDGLDPDVTSGIVLATFLAACIVFLLPLYFAVKRL